MVFAKKSEGVLIRLHLGSRVLTMGLGVIGVLELELDCLQS